MDLGASPDLTWHVVLYFLTRMCYTVTNFITLCPTLGVYMIFFRFIGF